MLLVNIVKGIGMAKSPVKREKRANGTGRLYKDHKQDRWVASFEFVKGRPIYKTTKYKKNIHVLEKWLADQRYAKEHGVTTRSLIPNMTITEFLTNWNMGRSHTIKSNSVRYYQQSIDHRITPFIGGLNASKLTTKSILEFISNLKKHGYSGSTIRGACITLNAAYNHAVKVGDIPFNPMKDVDIPEANSKPSKPIKKTDFAKIYNEAKKDPWMHARIEVGMFMGRRPAEAAGMKWSDLDLEEKRLNVERQIIRVKGIGLVVDTPKQDIDQNIPLSDDQIEIFLKLRRHQESTGISKLNEEDWIFPNDHGGRLSPEVDRKRWNRLLEASWVKPYQRYQMRKTAFSNLNSSGMDAKSLQKYSGHADVRTLMNSYVFGTTEAELKALAFQDDLRNSINTSEKPRLRAV
jgi:site-specific recombinase XerD